MEENPQKGTPRNRKFLFFGLLFVSCILLFAVIIYKLWTRNEIKPNISRSHDTVLQNIPESKAEAIEVLGEKTTAEIQNLLASESFSLDSFLEEYDWRVSPPPWQKNDRFKEIPFESYMEWLDQLNNVNLAYARELAELLSTTSPNSLEYDSIKQSMFTCHYKFRELRNRVEGISIINNEHKYMDLEKVIISISLKTEVDKDFLYSLEKYFKKDHEKLKFAKKRLLRAFNFAISFIDLFLPFEPGFATKEVLVNYLELRDYVMNNF